jgi:hypothetical protein
LLTYVVIYTPLKQRTTFSTVVGAVPGALPPMIGWAAATDTLSREAWVLFAIIFLWQMPHFLAIAWLFKDDYGRAGFRMLPVLEPDGRSTGYQVAAYASALLPVSMVPSLMGLTGAVYFAVSLLLGAAFLAVSLRFAVSRTRRDARVLFFTSITYLPLVWLAMVSIASKTQTSGRPLREPQRVVDDSGVVPVIDSGVVSGSLRGVDQISRAEQAPLRFVGGPGRDDRGWILAGGDPRRGAARSNQAIRPA